MAKAIWVFFRIPCWTSKQQPPVTRRARMSAEGVYCDFFERCRWQRKREKIVSNASITYFAMSKVCNAKRCDGRGRRFESYKGSQTLSATPVEYQGFSIGCTFLFAICLQLYLKLNRIVYIIFLMLNLT